MAATAAPLPKWQTVSVKYPTSTHHTASIAQAICISGNPLDNVNNYAKICVSDITQNKETPNEHADCQTSSK